MSISNEPRRRAGLLQERSRETRRRLVRSALHLWTERGFETGIEDTKVEEICQAAGVTKGTFYFHFAHKEDILLEMGVETATILNDTANRCVRADRGINDSLRTVMNALARNIKGTPPAAVSRALAEFRRPNRSASSYEGPAFAEAFEKLFAKAQEKGEVTGQIEASEMAQILEALVVDSIMEWSQGRLSRLNQALYRRAAIVVAGLHPDNALPL
ncbi:TetR/AcrR family transcriptional regulator [Parafrankia sp. EUN1f]|uniref:TetR/AcrR family transcriptional regulator n=1 Tax=Parafrankia sp. EUN1f TaxID=102897 RepID=UPI0001C4464A|nr:TetR/AcrR family transcriptional regulator [Parafrankia sp. EUN1f]EFC85511.1 transcriptional regulator, TetR family [Parafrankia sp. EUN1f]